MPHVLIRCTYRRGRRHWLSPGLNEWYEFKLNDGPIEVGNAPDISRKVGAALDVREFSTCLTRARALYSAGDAETWVFYPGGGHVRA